MRRVRGAPLLRLRLQGGSIWAHLWAGGGARCAGSSLGRCPPAWGCGAGGRRWREGCAGLLGRSAAGPRRLCPRYSCAGHLRADPGRRCRALRGASSKNHGPGDRERPCSWRASASRRYLGCGFVVLLCLPRLAGLRAGFESAKRQAPCGPALLRCPRPSGRAQAGPTVRLFPVRRSEPGKQAGSLASLSDAPPLKSGLSSLTAAPPLKDSEGECRGPGPPCWPRGPGGLRTCFLVVDEVPRGRLLCRRSP